MNERRAVVRRVLPALAGIAISVALLLWALRGVSIGNVVAQIQRAKPLPLAAAVIIATLTFPIRMLRWRLLLRDDRGAQLPIAPLWHAVAIGFMANNLLPFRAGELIRTFTVSRLAGARFTAALSSIAVERIFDGLAVVGLLGVALLASHLPPDVSVAGVPVTRVTQAAGGVAFTALIAASLVVAAPLAVERVVRGLLPGRAADRIVSMIEGVRHGLAALRSPGRLAGVIVWSLVLWLVNALAFYVCFPAFGIAAPYAGALVLQGLLVLGIALPSTPGFIGPFEAAIVAALALYAVPNEQAFSYAIAFHIATFIPIILLGAWSLARTPVQLADLRRRSA